MKAKVTTTSTRSLIDWVNTRKNITSRFHQRNAEIPPKIDRRGHNKFPKFFQKPDYQIAYLLVKLTRTEMHNQQERGKIFKPGEVPTIAISNKGIVTMLNENVYEAGGHYHSTTVWRARNRFKECGLIEYEIDNGNDLPFIVKLNPEWLEIMHLESHEEQTQFVAQLTLC